MRVSRHTYFLAGRLVVGTIFLYAGTIKALDVAGFAGQVAAYRLLPYAYNYLVAAALPYLEILCGLLLLLNLLVRPVLLVLGVLNIAFIAALGSVLLRGFEIDCGCFDPTGGSATGPTAALLRDLVIMGLVVLTWVLERRVTKDAGRRARQP